MEEVLAEIIEAVLEGIFSVLPWWVPITVLVLGGVIVYLTRVF